MYLGYLLEIIACFNLLFNILGFTKQIRWCNSSNNIQTTKCRVCLVLVFKNCFMFLKTKKYKKLVWGRGCVLVFCVFCVLKNHFFYNNKKMFSLFFHCSNNRLFFVFTLPYFCVSLAVFYVSTQVSSTQPPHHHTPTHKPFLLP